MIRVGQFYCTSKCPADQPYHHHESMSDGSLKSYCASEPFVPPSSFGVHEPAWVKCICDVTSSPVDKPTAAEATNFSSYRIRPPMYSAVLRVDVLRPSVRLSLSNIGADSAWLRPATHRGTGANTTFCAWYLSEAYFDFWSESLNHFYKIIVSVE